MGTIQDLSALVNRMSGGNDGTPEHITVYKDARVAGAAATSTVAGRRTSLFLYEGSPSHGAAPGAVAVPTSATAGGIFQANPGGGRQKWLVGMTASASSPGTLTLYDRILHISGLDGTVTTAQTVGGTIDRYAGGAGNQIWLEIYTIIGVTSTTITAEYTDQDGNTGAVTPTVVIGGTGFREAQRILPMTLASGDSGVRAVASVDLLATTGTAGNFGVTVAHPLASVVLSGNAIGAASGFVKLPGPIEILTDACLAFAWDAQASATPWFQVSLHFVED